MLEWIALLFGKKQNQECLFYIGGSDYLPPPLKGQEEQHALELLEQGDEGAKQLLIEHNLRLVVFISRRFENTGVNLEDLISIGTIGLIKAITTFDASKGARLATYAARCVENEILMYFRSRKKLAPEISIHETIDIDRDGNPLTYMDVICSEEDVADEIDRKVAAERMLSLMETCLLPREKQILMMRYGIGGIKPQTQREIAASLSISRSYVSRIEKSALLKLREAMGGRS